MRPVMLQTETALWKTGHVAGAVDHGMQSSTISLRPGPDRGISSSYSKDPCPDRSRVLVAVTTMIRTRYSDPVDCSWCGHAACGPRRGGAEIAPPSDRRRPTDVSHAGSGRRAAADHREHPSGSAAGVGCARANRAAENWLAAAGTPTEGKRSSSRPTRNVRRTLSETEASVRRTIGETQLTFC